MQQQQQWHRHLTNSTKPFSAWVVLAAKMYTVDQDYYVIHSLMQAAENAAAATINSFCLFVHLRGTAHRTVTIWDDLIKIFLYK